MAEPLPPPSPPAPTPAAGELSRWIIERETAGGAIAGNELGDAIRTAFDRLRVSVAGLIGIVGFGAVMARAVHLARPRFPWLEAPAIGGDGTATAKELAAKVNANGEGPAEVIAAATALLENILSLLCTFIGEDLTFRLIRRIWPDLPGGAAGGDSQEDKLP